MGKNMNKLKLASCEECDDLVAYDIYDKIITEIYKGEQINYRFKVGRCKQCGAEVATDNDYNFRKSREKIEAYKQAKGIITLAELSELQKKYDIGKEALALVSGFGSVTIKRYYEGFIPSLKYSDILKRMLNDEKFFVNRVQENKEKIKDAAYRRIMERYIELLDIGSSKISQISNYIITRLGEVTPLALEKLLLFSEGVNYALNGTQLIEEECQAWQHGPVYPVVYNKYKKYGYRPIDNGVYSSHGCLVSKLSQEEIEAIDLVLNTFGWFSPKTLEMISHLQLPWLEKRVGYKSDESGTELIDEEAVKQYYIHNKLNSQSNLEQYIIQCMQIQN